jgi:hypothetical protein
LYAFIISQWGLHALHVQSFLIWLPNNTGLFKKKYTLSKIYFTSTVEHMAMCYI